MNFTVANYRIPFEAAFWLASIAVLGVLGTLHSSLFTLHSSHVTLCVPTLLGFDGCIGCGLGHSIGLALRGDVEGSLWAHSFGIPALGILLYRSVSLIIRNNTTI